MVRASRGGDRQVIIIPNHKQIDPGTLKEIYRKARHYIAEKDLESFFFS